MSQQSSIQALEPFEMVVDTTIAGDSGVGNFQLLLQSGFDYRYKVEWGDGSISASTTTTNLTHTYPSGGTYTIKIYGRFDRYRCNNTSECDKIISINSWGNIVWKDFANSFYGSGNLTGITSDTPIMEQMDGGMIEAFRECPNLDFNIGAWDVSKSLSLTSLFYNSSTFNNGGSPSISGWTINSGVTSLSAIFRGASSFNQPIGSWDVSNVISMNSMFLNAFIFNQDISAWDVSNVTNFYQMFYLMDLFNNGGSPSISGWTINTTNPSGVNMGGMFKSCIIFNQDISAWDVSNVTNMSSMFSNADQFNQPIGSWDVSNVTDMSYMFNEHQTFNEDLTNWNVSGVTDMSYMFNNQAGGGDFNNSGSAGISGWTTSDCLNMSNMFKRQTNFNQPIGSWDVGNVQDFSDFLGVGIGSNMSFNQDLSSWDVSNSTDLSLMFDGCDNFDQDLGGWSVSGVTDMTSMLDDTNLSVGNYNSILTGWTGWDGTGATKTLVSGVTFGAIGLNFTSGSTAEDARNYLITGLTWTITDGGGV